MFDLAVSRIAGRFKRVEPRATARAFVLALLSGLERKNCWRLAEHAGHARPGPMQRLLRTTRWDADAVRDDIRAYVVDQLGADDGVLIVDETGFLRKGTASTGVQRQYTGTAGRIENTQVGVFLAYASSKGRALIDRRLYLPDASWSQDAERRARAGVPDQVEFATRPTLAGQMIAAALDAGIGTSWVTGDEAYGQDPGLRALLESRRVGYVLAGACSTRVLINQGRTTARADAVADRLPASAWHRQSAGAGAKGPRYYDWAWIEIGADCHRHLLIRRNPSSGELAFYRAGPPGECRCPSWSEWPGPGGASKNASRPRKARSAWTTTRSATGPLGTGTSPWPCSHWPSSPHSPPMRRRSGPHSPTDPSAAPARLT